MNEAAELVRADQADLMPSVSTEQIKARIGAIMDVMRHAMKEGEHYGKIPGAGDKPCEKDKPPGTSQDKRVFTQLHPLPSGCQVRKIYTAPPRVSNAAAVGGVLVD